MLLTAGGVAAVVGPVRLSAAEVAPEPQPPHKTFREAVRTFAADGRYLLTFPARTTKEGAWWTTGFVAGTALLIGRDDEIREEILESDSRTAGRIATKFEPLGRGHVAAASLGVFYLVGRVSGKPEVVSTAATAFEAFFWDLIIASVAKGAFGRERPTGNADAHGFFGNDSIFPSGKTSRSFAVAVVLADRYGRKAAFVAYPVATLVGLATLQQDTHWASDILAGAGLGLAIGKGIAARHPAAGRQARSEPGAEWQVAPLPGGATLRITY